jgi:hypothetical protein
VHLPLSVPSRFSQLARLLVVLDEARSLTEPAAKVRRAACRSHPVAQASDYAALEAMALLSSDATPRRPVDELAKLSLTYTEDRPVDPHDALVALGLLAPTVREPEV